MGESRELTELKEKYKSNPEILEFLQNITKSYHISIIHKVLMNDRIAKNINVHKLQNLIYGEKKDETLISILVETYGEGVRQTLKEHHYINADNIHNFDVLDEKFRNTFEKYTMGYFLKADDEIIDKMANDLDENSMQYYNAFENMIPNIFYYPVDLERKLNAFYDNIDTIKLIVDGGKKEEEIANLTNKILKKEFEELKKKKRSQVTLYNKPADIDDFFSIANKIDANLNSGNDMVYTQIAILINLVRYNFSEYTNLGNENNFSEGLVNLIRNRYGKEAGELFDEEFKDENILPDDNQQSKELRNYYYIKKLFNTSLIAYDKKGLEYIKKLKELKEKFKNNPEISEFLKTVFIGAQTKTNILYSVLTDEKMAKNVDGSILEAIYKNNEDSHKAFSNLVGIAYGEEAGEILKERPDLKIDRDIPNFDIFDKDIREMIGYGGVHTFLTYYMESASIISEIAENKDLIRYYKEFEKITGDYFPPSAVGLEERLINFKEHLDLIIQMVDSGHPEQYVENFLLYLTDKEFHEDEIEGLRVNNIEELGIYREKRGDVFKQRLEEGEDTIRQYILNKYFGRWLSNLHDGSEKFLEDYLKFSQTNLTEDEIDLIELYYILQRCDNDMLNTIYQLFEQGENIITPTKMRSINLKVAEDYKTEYLNSLLTVERAEEMVEKDEASIKDISNPIDAYEISKKKSRRYIIKENDDNLYFVDHKKTQDGECIYRDCIVTETVLNTRYEKEPATCYEYKYKNKNGEIIIKQIYKPKNAEGIEYTKYIMNERWFILKNGEAFIYHDPYKDDEKFGEFFYNVEEIISESELIPQYNPEEEFKLEEGDVEGYILNGITSDKLCVSLIRYGNPTSKFFSYKGLDRK